MTCYQECMDADDRVMAHFASTRLFLFVYLKTTKHSETARIVNVVTKCGKA